MRIQIMYKHLIEKNNNGSTIEYFCSDSKTVATHCITLKWTCKHGVGNCLEECSHSEMRGMGVIPQNSHPNQGEQR